jgi:hypothetical protein
VIFVEHLPGVLKVHLFPFSWPQRLRMMNGDLDFHFHHLFGDLGECTTSVVDRVPHLVSLFT